MILEGCDSSHSLRDCTHTQNPFIIDFPCTHSQSVLPSTLLRVGPALQGFRLSEGLPTWPKAMAFYPGIKIQVLQFPTPHLAPSSLQNSRVSSSRQSTRLFSSLFVTPSPCPTCPVSRPLLLTMNCLSQNFFIYYFSCNFPALKTKHKIRPRTLFYLIEHF